MLCVLLDRADLNCADLNCAVLCNWVHQAEHRSITPLPYWDLPFANELVPRLRRFNADLQLLNDVLEQLIKQTLDTQNKADVDELEKRNYYEMENPSLLRFLVDMRGEDTTSTQLRDDLMTMLIAGHETTAAVLTWANVRIIPKSRFICKSSA